MNTLFQKYLKYIYKILLPQKYLNTSTKILAAGRDGGYIEMHMYGNVVTIKFWLIVNEND